MVYYDPTNLAWKPYVKSWMQRVGDKFKAETQVTSRGFSSFINYYYFKKDFTDVYLPAFA